MVCIYNNGQDQYDNIHNQELARVEATSPLFLPEYISPPLKCVTKKCGCDAEFCKIYYEFKGRWDLFVIALKVHKQRGK